MKFIDCYKLKLDRQILTSFFCCTILHKSPEVYQSSGILLTNLKIMLVVKFKQADLNIEKTYTCKQLAEEINEQMFTDDKLELIAAIVNDIKFNELNPADLNAIKEFANNLYQSALIRKD